MSAAAIYADDLIDTGIEYEATESRAMARSSALGFEQLETLSGTYPVLSWDPSQRNRITATGLEDLRAFFERAFAAVPEVARVKVAEREKHGNRIVHVWSMLHRDDRDTRFKVYDVEEQLSRRFPELLFEFHSHLVQPDAPDGDTAVYEP